MMIRDSIGMKEYIEKHCGFTVLNLMQTENGSGNTFIVSTDSGRYVAKRGERSDFLALYQKAQPFLENCGLEQSHIVYCDEELTLYEWLEGESYKTLTPERTDKAIQYMHRYFSALKKVPANANEIKRINTWDDAKSLPYLLDTFPKNPLFQIDPSIAIATEHLAVHRTALENLPTQLIHSDLGGDNFLFHDHEVKAIIDFTPEIASELYGLCHFLYWNVLWQDENPYSLHKWADRYSDQIDYEVLDLLMIQVALFRIVGPLLNGDAYREKRILLIKKLLEKI